MLLHAYHINIGAEELISSADGTAHADLRVLVSLHHTGAILL
jgi:hypothetical protein